MNIGEYQDRQYGITTNLVLLILRLLSPFKAAQLSSPDWVTLLEVAYPHVEEARRKSAELGREFYDSQREAHAPEADLHEFYRANYDFEWFVEAMRPEKHRMSQPGAGESEASQFAERVAKEVENGGRRSILRGVESDPLEPRWARVATGRETCGFCMMLVSRGPVYQSAEQAGLDLTETEAMRAFNDNDLAFMDQNMNKWHPGCDCKVVPVFDKKNWPGRDAHLRALELWKEASSEGRAGKDALNALRRAVENGDVEESNFAIAA